MGHSVENTGICRFSWLLKSRLTRLDDGGYPLTFPLIWERRRTKEREGIFSSIEAFLCNSSLMFLIFFKETTFLDMFLRVFKAHQGEGIFSSIEAFLCCCLIFLCNSSLIFLCKRCLTTLSPSPFFAIFFTFQLKNTMIVGEEKLANKRMK